MKVMAILFRVVFSIIVLLSLACYQTVSPTISLGDFCSSIDIEQVASLFKGVNIYTISLGLILLLGILSCTRILEAAWNVVFCASIIILAAGGLYAWWGPQIALPSVLSHNEAVTQLCQSMLTYEVPIAITLLIFVAGWICAPSCGRVAITAVISYALWYGLTAFFTYIVKLWAGSTEPVMPEALALVENSPWVVAAVPAAFFLIYALLMAFFETFITTKTCKAAPKEAKADAPGESVTETKTEAVPATPQQKTKPITEPKQKTLRLNTGAPATTKKLKTAEVPADKEKSAPVQTSTQQESKPKAEATDTSSQKEDSVKEESAKEESVNDADAQASPKPESEAKQEETEAPSQEKDATQA